MFTTTNSNAPAVDDNLNLSSMSAMIARAKHHLRPMTAEVLCGDINRFIDRLNREVGLTPANSTWGDVAGDPKATFAGVPVVVSDLLPSNMAVVKLNGEVVQIIRFE